MPVWHRARGSISLRLMTASIYEFPQLFRAVHLEKPEEIADETAFLKRVWARHLTRPVRRVLDIACGDSPHGILLARGGIEVAGVDRSPTMIAKGRADARGLKTIRFYRRPIERFSIPERPFDAAFFASETFPVMTGNRAILSHFKSVARRLRRGGLYCIDIDRQDPPRMRGGRKLWRRRRVKVGDTLIKVSEFECPMPWYSGTWIYELACEIRFPDRVVFTRDLVPIRYTLPNLLDFAARASGSFEMIACYTDLSFTAPLERCDRRWLGVLRRI